MKMILLTLALVSLTAASGIAAPAEEEERRFVGIMVNPSFVERNREERERLCNIGWQLWSEGSLSKEHVEVALAVLGDAKAKSLVVQRIRADPLWSDFEGLIRAGNPVLLIDLMPEVFQDQPFKVEGTDMLFYPTSHAMTHQVLKLLANSPQFNSDVINWARRFDYLTLTDEARAIIRQWWRANEHFFVEGNYKAVQPGPEPKPIPEKVFENVPSAPSGPLASGSPLPDNLAAGPLPRSNNFVGYAILAFCVALLAVAACLLSVKRRG